MAPPEKNLLENTSLFSLLRNWDFLLMWGGQTISLLGSQISALAMPLLVLAITNSPIQASFVSALQSLPYLVLGLPAGAFVDRWERKRVMIICGLMSSLSYALVPLAYILGYPILPLLYIVAFSAGTSLVFYEVAEGAAFPHVVSAGQLPLAAILAEGSVSAMEALGPGLGGLIINAATTLVTGGILAYFIDSISYLCSAISLLCIRTSFQSIRTSTEVLPLSIQIKSGLSFSWSHPRLRPLILLVFFSHFILSPSGLAVIVLARNYLYADARTIGFIFFIGSGSSLLCAIGTSLIRTKLHFRFGYVILITFIMQALAMPILATATSSLMLAIGWIAYTFMYPIYYSMLYTYRVGLVPDELQGRVNSVFRLLSLGGIPLGTALGGVLIGIFGPRFVLWLVLVGIGVCILFVNLTQLRKD